MNLSKPYLVVLALLLCVCATGCASVAPWERGNMAKPHMALEPDHQRSTMREHIHSSREAASGENAAEGGGCGCN